MIISKSYRDGWKVQDSVKKPPNRSSFIEQKKGLLVFVYSFSFVFDVFEEKKENIVLTFFYFMHINPVSIFLFFSRVLNFWSQGSSWIYKILVMKNHWEQSGFLPSPSCSSQHVLLFVSVTLCYAKMVTILVRSRACCALVNKLSTLFGFAVHCKMRYFNISLDELLFIQVFKCNL